MSLEFVPRNLLERIAEAVVVLVKASAPKIARPIGKPVVVWPEE